MPRCRGLRFALVPDFALAIAATKGKVNCVTVRNLAGAFFAGGARFFLFSAYPVCSVDEGGRSYRALTVRLRMYSVTASCGMRVTR